MVLLLLWRVWFIVSIKLEALACPDFRSEQMDETVFESAKRMMSSATFGQVIILMVYLPIMALVGIEGKMFRPMAQVVIFALLGAAILSLTYVPMASALFLNKNTVKKQNISDKLMVFFQRVFDPMIAFALKSKAVWFPYLPSFCSSSVCWFLIVWVVNLFLSLKKPHLAAESDLTLQGGSLTNTIEICGESQ